MMTQNMSNSEPNLARTWSIALAAATLTATPLTAAPLHPFEVTFLEAPANSIKIEPSSRSAGINLKGEVAGRTFYRNEDELPGFVLMQGVGWNANGSPSLLSHYDGPTYGVFHADGINDAGQIAGSASPRTTGDYNSRAVRWETDGSVTALEEPSNGDVSGAYGINNAGQVAGYARPYVGIRAARWEADGTLNFLGVLPDYDPFNNHSEAYAIAESGYAARFYDSNINDPQRTFRSARWDPDGNLQILGDLPGFNTLDTRARDINSAGIAVGAIVAESQATGGQGIGAIRWNEVGDAELLAGPDGQAYAVGWANAITDDGYIVGHVGPNAFDTQALIWDPQGTAYRLEDFLPEAFGDYDVVTPFSIAADDHNLSILALIRDINDQTYTVALRSTFTVIPEPATAALIALGTLALLPARRRSA